MIADSSFQMTVEDVFSIKNRGVVATGKVESGVLRVDDEVYLRGPSGEKKLKVKAIEAFHKVMTEAFSGDNVGVLFEGITRDDINRGDVLSGSDMG